MVPGKPRWNKRDSAIIIGVVVAGVLVILAYLLPLVFVGYISTGPIPPKPIGTAFEATDPLLENCSMNSTYPSSGCFAGDYVYVLSIFASSIAFDSVEFEVTNATGSVVWLFSDGGFSIVNGTGVVQASSTPSNHLVMTGTWNTYAPWVAGATPLTNHYDILIDMGVGDPAGAHLLFVATGTGPYVDSTAGLPLP